MRQLTVKTLKAAALYFALVFGSGLIALGLLPGAEFLAVRHLSIRDYAASRDALAGFVYIVMLLFFAVMPSFVGRR